jgi:hypothetical protein
MEDQVETVNEPEEAPDEIQTSSSGGSRTWMLIIGGIVLLLLGGFLGYFGRGAFGPEAMAVKATSTADAGAVQTRAATNKDVMDLVINQTRHFKGDANALVTLIEFSDFQ